MKDSKNLKKIKNFWNNTKKIDRLYWIIIGIIFLVFIVQALFFTCCIKENLPPDEFYHVRLSQIYSKTFGLVDNSESTYYLGDISRIPFLFHWLAGRVINIKNLILPSLKDYIVLRLFSVFVGCLNVLTALKIIRFFTKDKLVHILFLTMLTHTLMFVLISSGVNYDPLTILFSFLLIMFTLKLCNSHKIETFALVVLVTLLGCITKTTFLPIAFVNFLFVVIHEIKHIQKYKEDGKILITHRENLLKVSVYLVFIVFFAVLTVNLYGVNLIRYHSIQPNCSKVIGVENCMQNGVFATYFELKKVAPPEESLLKLFWYIPHWLHLMTDRTYGIFAHLKLSLTYQQFSAYFLIFVLGALKFIRVYDKKKVGHSYFLLLVVSYTIVLMVIINYLVYYKSNGVIHAAVQGRYMFPVLAPLYALVSLSLLSFKNKYVRWFLFVCVMVVFLYGNIPFFVRNVTDEWFAVGSNGFVILQFVKKCFYFFYDKIKNLLIL